MKCTTPVKNAVNKHLITRMGRKLSHPYLSPFLPLETRAPRVLDKWQFWRFVESHYGLVELEIRRPCPPPPHSGELGLTHHSYTAIISAQNPDKRLILTITEMLRLPLLFLQSHHPSISPALFLQLFTFISTLRLLLAVSNLSVHLILYIFLTGNYSKTESLIELSMVKLLFYILLSGWPFCLTLS